MSIHNKTATVFGGTGFLGRQVVRELARRGVRVKVASRVPERAYFLRTAGTVGQVVPMFCDYTDAESIRGATAGSDYVVNCIGVLFEKGGIKFKKAHTEIPGLIARACAETGVKRLVHISALGVAQSKARYAKTKFAGEQAVQDNFPGAVILRPSVIFGEDDNFFNMFARLARVLPVLPLIGGGVTKFQPVYVGDVADAVMAALILGGEDGSEGKIYELGGPEILRFREIYQRLFCYTGQKRILIALPWWLAKFEAFFLARLPRPLLTPDQVESLKTDNIVTPGALGLTDLGVQPTAMEMILPRYLSRFRDGGRFSDLKKAA